MAHYSREDLELYRSKQMSVLKRIACTSHLKECAECARLLEIEPKAASIRYVRALQRLREKLAEYTEFKP